MLAVRIIVPDELDCYLVLGILHTNFNPLTARFKDYIALPKQNGYRTLHTTLFDDQSIIEAQIRTFNMHKTAEYGLAAHWKYKHSGAVAVKTDWLKDISQIDEHEKTPEDLYEFAKDSLYVEDIAVYSPTGRIFTLPRGATALDYAYEIHSEVGLHASEAYINKIKVPLLTELKNGDIVRIITGDEPKLRCSWLNSVKTGKARVTIRNYCRQKLREINEKVARKIISAIFSRPVDVIESWILSENLSKKIFKVSTDSAFLQDVVNALKKYGKDKILGIGGLGKKYEIKKQKCDNIVIYSNYKITSAEFDYCCNPKRGDDIMGFRHGHRAVVHHKLCERASKLLENGEEMIFVRWTKVAPDRYKIILSLENKRGSLAEFLTDLAKLKIDLVTINLADGGEEDSAEYFELVVQIVENVDSQKAMESLKNKYKIVEFSSLADAYSS